MLMTKLMRTLFGQQQIAVSADRRLLQTARLEPGRDRHADGLPAVHRAGRCAVLGQRGRALETMEDGAAVLAVLLGGVHAVPSVCPAGGPLVSRRQQQLRCARTGIICFATVFKKSLRR